MSKSSGLASSELRLRKTFVKVAKEVYERGFVSATGGNISARIPRTNQVLMKPTGLRLKDLTPQRLVLLDLKGNVIMGKGGPSKEKRFHLGIYRVRKDVGAVIHTHSPAITAFATAGRKIPLITFQAKKFIGDTPLVGPAPPGSKKLADLVIKAFKDPRVKAALLRNHGSVVVGRDLEEAFNILSLLEETAKTALFIEQLSKGK